MKCNKEYYFHKSIESIGDVVNALREAGFTPSRWRKCDLEGRIISHRITIAESYREYEVTCVEDCLKFIVNDASMLGEMVRAGSIVEV